MTLSDEEKLKLILQLREDHDITAYEIGKYTGMSSSGIQRIFNGEIKKPTRETLDKILTYLEKRFPERNIFIPENIMSEPDGDYSAQMIAICRELRIYQANARANFFKNEEELDRMISTLEKMIRNH